MTYIVGFRQPGMNAIICDTRVTRTRSSLPSDNAVVKSGFLFPGCIFGRAGSSVHSERFVRALRTAISGKKDTPQGFWQRLERFSEDYPFSERQTDRFELLLSTRAFGQPVFFVLDSCTGLNRIEREGDCYLESFGSGKRYLDDRIHGSFNTWLQKVQQLMFNRRFSMRLSVSVAPYFLCLWLSELSLTSEKGILEEKYCVGGVFHFVYQNLNDEDCQWPAVYVFSALAGRKSVAYYLYRVVRFPSALYVLELLPHGQHAVAPDGEEVEQLGQVLYDSIAGPPLGHNKPDLTFNDEDRRLSPAELEQRLQKKLVQLVDAQPFYQYLGFGFTDPRYRSSIKFSLCKNGRFDDIFGPDGMLVPEYREYVERAFSSGDSAEFLHR